MRNKRILSIFILFFFISFCFSEEMAKNSPVNFPFSPALDNYGNLYFIELHPFCQVKKIDGTGKVSSLTGPNTAPKATFIVPEPASRISIPNPCAVAVDNSGNVYIVDAQQWTPGIVKIDRQGYIRRIVGGPYSSIAKIEIKYPAGLAPSLQTDSSDNLYFAVNSPTGKIYKLDNKENVSLIAEIPKGVFSLALNNTGEVYVGTSGEIYKINADKKAIKICGKGEQGFDGDGGPAISAKIHTPSGLAFDKDGNLYIADRWNYRIRKIDTNGIITTVAGTGKHGFTLGKSPAVSSPIGNPTGITIDKKTGIIYFTDTESGNGADRIMKIENGELETVAGGWEAVYSSSPPDSYLARLSLTKMRDYYFNNKKTKEYEEILRKDLSLFKEKDENRLTTWKLLLQILIQDKGREKECQSMMEEFINEWKDKPEFCIMTINELFGYYGRDVAIGKWLLKKGFETFPEQELSEAMLKNYIFTPNLADKDEIIPLCKEFIKKYPKSIFIREIKTRIADELMMQKQYKEAENIWKECLNQYPDYAYLYLWKIAQCAKSDNRPSDAIPYLTQLEKIEGYYGSSAEKYSLQEKIAIYQAVPGNEEKIKELTERIETFKKMQESFEKACISADNKAKANDFIGAVNEIEKYIAEYSLNEETAFHLLQNRLFGYLSKWENKDDAEKKLLELTKGTYLIPTQIQIIYNIGLFYARIMKNGDKALDIALKLMDKTPEYYNFLQEAQTVLLSNPDFKTKNYEKSWEVVKRFIELLWTEPHRNWAFGGHVYFARKLTSPEEKIEWLKKCVEIFPFNYKVLPQSELIGVLNQLAKEEEDYKILTEEYEKYIKMLENIGRTYQVIEESYKLGKIYEEKMRRKNIEAVKWYEKAVKLMPTHPSAILAKEALDRIR